MASGKAATDSYRQSVEQVVHALGTDARKGLAEDAARARLERDGPNELAAEKRIPAWRKVVAQFKDVLVILLLIATVISTVVWIHERDTGLPYEAVAILAIVLLNALVGYLQESRAESASAALRVMTAPQARVLRDGETRTIPAAQVVAGDIILLEEGDTVPAEPDERAVVQAGRELVTVGSGDSMVAGMAVALARGDDIEAALQLRAAAGAATAASAGTGLGTADDVSTLLAAVEVEALE